MTDRDDKGGSNRFSILIPFLLALFLAIGIGIGYLIKGDSPEKVSVFTRNQYDKVEEILNYIDNRYVDTVNTKGLFNKAINEIFKNLDPHSMYISPEELARINEPLEGKFEGIGVEFFIVEDTITVVAALPGGPSQQLGIEAGDRIVTINDSSVAGIGIDNNEVVSRLKGPANTKVSVGIKRTGVDTLIPFDITRGSVNISSIDAAYMMNDKVGYVKMSRFAANTHEEFVDAVRDLKDQGMEKMLLDLRDNGGGYLDQATKIADEFLAGDKLIVYTQGRVHDRKNYRAGSRGIFEDGELVLLINENSASASEILAGALQDWDRATVVGRRSFGKALVQEEILLENGGAMRLTTARYYTPKGRSIQRSYEKGVDKYRNAHYDRIISEYEHSGDFADHDTARYGIAPDVYVAFDTSRIQQVVNTLMNNGSISTFAYNYFSDHTTEFSQYKTATQFLQDYKVSDTLFEKFINYNGLDTLPGTGDSLMTLQYLDSAKTGIMNSIKAYFAKQLFYNNGFFPVYNKNDEGIGRAIESLQN